MREAVDQASVQTLDTELLRRLEADKETPDHVWRLALAELARREELLARFPGMAPSSSKEPPAWLSFLDEGRVADRTRRLDATAARLRSISNASFGVALLCFGLLFLMAAAWVVLGWLASFG